MIRKRPVATRTACSAANTDEEGAEWGPKDKLIIMIIMIIITDLSLIIVVFIVSEEPSTSKGRGFCHPTGEIFRSTWRIVYIAYIVYCILQIYLHCYVLCKCSYTLESRLDDFQPRDA